MKKLAIATFAALATMAAQAEPIQLASIAAIDGKILVNKGKGFVSAKPGMPLAEGDRVIALDGAKAAVVYADGCTTQVTENSLLALAKGAGCNAQPVKTGGPVRVAQAIGGTATDTKPKDTTDKRPAGAPPADGTSSTGVILIGGGILAGGMIADGYRSDNRPISGQ